MYLFASSSPHMGCSQKPLQDRQQQEFELQHLELMYYCTAKVLHSFLFAMEHLGCHSKQSAVAATSTAERLLFKG